MIWRALTPRTRARNLGSKVGGALRALAAGWLTSFTSRPRVTTHERTAYATPLVRRTAEQLDVDLALVIGTGVGDRIRPVDVQAAALLRSCPELDRRRAVLLVAMAGAASVDELELMLALLPAEAVPGLLDLVAPAAEVAQRLRARHGVAGG